ncbi:hypothetical protein [Shouchella hunanensis]|uniref:Uncharacterized protein n=1 Tax=Shouchella hunanensis TaxID=766894 RepID=A0ABY7VZS5_9BACI|nr:hypothetical protein [Shouchella hunanensis]WDF02212.1 hypothetical protein PQ477_11815 [Shouchella hunanensis]
MKKWIVGAATLGTILIVSLFFFQIQTIAPEENEQFQQPLLEAIVQAREDVAAIDGLRDKGIEKWAIRLRINQLTTGDVQSEEDLVAQAKLAYAKRNDLLIVAEEVYDVDMSEIQIHTFINEELEQVDDAFMEPIASAHGMSLEAFMFEWEYDHFAYNYAWREIGSQLEEEFPIQEGETTEEYNERLREEWRSKIEKM